MKIFVFRMTYRGFHITFDEWVPKFVRNFRSSQRTWQFDYVVTNEVANFVAKFGSLLRSSEQSLELNFIEAVSTFMIYYKLFNPARKNHLKNRSGKNCRPLTGRQRTNTNWKISESWQTDRVFQVLLIIIFRKGWQGYSIHSSRFKLVKVSAVSGRSFINIFNQCSYASVECWSKPIYGEDLKKKTIRILVEFYIHKRRHLIFQIHLKFGQREGKKVCNFVLKFVLIKFPNFATKFATSLATI